LISKITTYLPPTELANEEIAAHIPDWNAQQIFDKTGIRRRHVAGPDESSADLAYAAGRQMLEQVPGGEIDFLILCTQTPPRLIPATACVLQHRLGLRTDCGAFDFNLGCSGYVYGLALGQSLIAAGHARKILLLTADTYTHHIQPADRATRPIFGDAGTATVLSSDCAHRLHGFVFGTDGSGADQLCLRPPEGAAAPNLHMNGPEIFNFTLNQVPKLVTAVLARAGLAAEQIDLFLLHQANRFMLDHLRRKLGISPEKMPLYLEAVGNTVSGTIPLLLQSLWEKSALRPGMKILLAGFGVGYSWAGCVVEIR
jgi:3-oxoacyl-[acyl-carrier-protein] synthase III